MRGALRDGPAAKHARGAGGLAGAQRRAARCVKVQVVRSGGGPDPIEQADGAYIGTPTMLAREAARAAWANSAATRVADPPGYTPAEAVAAPPGGPVNMPAVSIDSRGYAQEVMNLSFEDEAHMTLGLDPTAYTSGPVSNMDMEPPAQAPPPPPPAPVVAPEKAAARQLLASFNCMEYIGERHHWMMILAPEQPVAGEDCIVLFNRLQSETLRVRPRIQMQYGFNAWGLKQESGAPYVVDLAPAPMTKELSDFWWARIKVPSNTYELNFVLTDGEGLYENNGGQDFMFPVVAGITAEQWESEIIALEKQRALERLEAERRAAQEAEAQRQEELRKQDAAKGAQRANDIIRVWNEQQAQGVTLLRQGGQPTGPVVWCVEPKEPRAGSQVTLHYNRKASQLHWVNVQQDQAMTLRWGVNKWQGVQVVQMERFKPYEVTLPATPAPKAPAPRAPPAPAPVAPGSELAGAAVLAGPDMPAVEPPPVLLPPLKRAVTRPPVAPLPPAGTEEEWWTATLDIPFEAGIVNFVINYFEHYDNNGQKDYAMKVAVPQGHTFESWSTALPELFRKQEFEVRMAAEAEAKQREMRRQEQHKKMRDHVMVVERRKVRHVLFTEPEVITAGQEVTLWYNTWDTPLRDRAQVYLLAGFNRWSHRQHVGPLAMTPPDAPPVYDEYGREVSTGEVRSGSPTHWKATFMVPDDAFKLDFVFSDVPGGEGTYDNRGGYDYHLPVEGSPFKEQSLYVAHISVELAPIAKVGGLGDVVTALGRAVKEQGHQVEVLLPKYEFFNHHPQLAGQLKYETEFDWGGTRVFVTTAIVENLRVWFIEPRNGFFQTQTVYGRYDDEVRFDFFCKAALEFLLRTGRQPDILHCHDWSTAHVAKAYWEDYNPYGLYKPKVVFTIHNLNYGQKKITEAAYYSQKFTTVSPTYAFETGSNPVIAGHVQKFQGIRNGIDYELWDPEHNAFLPQPITPETVVQGKAAARAELRKRVNLTSWQDKLIVAVVSRLTPQKGVHLIKHTAFRTVDRGGQFVLLGSAPDPKVQAEFDTLAQEMWGQDSAFCFKYDEPLSHLIYAAADIVVVPSMFEPCGLTQMIAMRYGAVPVVRHTGGLRDTVFDVDYDKGRAAWELEGCSDWERDGVDVTNGFAFEGTDTGALDYALNRAIDAWYNDKPWFHSLQRRVMEQDWTWNRPALDYIELYFGAIKS